MSAETDGDGNKTQPTEQVLNVVNTLNNPNDSTVQSELQTDTTTKADTNATAPTSEYDILFAQLKEKPYNPEGWRRLIDWVENSGDIDKLRSAFEALLQTYPNTASAQIRYIDHFLNDQETFPVAEELFKKFLKLSPSVDLWKFYLTYVRRVNSGPATRDSVRKSYEFALNHVGQDKDSGEIWRDYIQFLKSGEATTTWEEQQKMDALRKVYHRAVQIPLENVEALWQELEAFETNLSKITAKKFMSDLSPAHMQARSTLRALISATASLYPPASPPVTPGRPELSFPPVPTFNSADRALVGKWKNYLKWEESNPLEIDEKDKATLISRIQGVYRKAVIRMRFFAEIWFMAYTWTSSIGKLDEAMSILRAGMEANPNSFLLTFAYAEALELKKDYAEVHSLFDKFLVSLQADLEVVDAHTKAEVGIRSSPTPQPGNGNGMDISVNGNESSLGSQNSSFHSTAEESKSKTTELAERRSEYGLTYIIYMRFARRVEGAKASRAVFGRARKDKWAPWEVYEAAALMEYHCSDEKQVASRIFERGLELFGEEVEFVLRYLGFLISVNDINNARALFERVIGNFPPEDARPLWERWARYEYQYGDLDASQKLETRISQIYTKEPPIKRFAQRHTYLNIDAIASRDLGAAMARRLGEKSEKPGDKPGLGKSDTLSTLQSGSVGAGSSMIKRPLSPDYLAGRGGAGGSMGGPDYSQGHKRARSPVGSRGDRDGRWDGSSGPRRRLSPPPPTGWGDVRESREAREAREARDRERTIPPPRVQERERLEKERVERERMERAEREREERERRARQVNLPQVISWFVGELPRAASFDGPVFRTEDLMNLFRNAVIPSSSRNRPSPPPPPPRGRPPPDYGPYQGPGGRRRY